MRKPVPRRRRSIAPPAPRATSPSQGRPGAPVDVGRLLLALRRHWRVIPLAMMLGAAAGVAVAKLVIKRTYTATSVLIWEPHPNTNVMTGERDLSTSIRSVTLQANLLEVRRRLGLATPLKAMEASLRVHVEPGSNLVTISADASEADPAVALADTTIEVFLEHEQRLLQARSQETVERIEADLESARSKLAAARETYDAFRAEHGIADLSTETQLAIQKVATLRASADLARTDAEALGARATQLAQIAKQQSARQVQSATHTDTLLSRRLALEADLAAARSRLSADHPAVVALEEQLAAARSHEATSDDARPSTVTVGVNAQLEMLKTTIAQSTADREAALQRQEHYKRYAAEAEQRLQQLSSVEGQASGLLSNIALFEERVNRLEAELVGVQAVSRAPRSEFRAVTPAMVPEEAQSARKKVAAISPILSALLTVLVLLARELRGLRVITATEAAYWAGAPVVASSGWPRDSELLQPLVDELADFAPLSVGTTLVLPAGEAEAPLAREIAYWLSTMKLPERAQLTADTATSQPAATVADATTGAHAIVHQPAGASAAAGRVAAHTWDGEPDGQAIRRAARLASRVLVVLRSGSLSAFQLAQLQARLGRTSGIGILLVGLDDEFVHLADRAGDFHAFWTVDDAQA